MPLGQNVTATSSSPSCEGFRGRKKNEGSRSAPLGDAACCWAGTDVNGMEMEGHGMIVAMSNQMLSEST